MRKVKFAESMKVIRNKLKLTQEEIAEISNVTRQTVSAWEKGIAVPNIDVVAKLSNTFGITTDNLIFGSLNTNTRIIEPSEEETTMNKNYILNIKKGYHTIVDEDIKEFGAFFAFDFSFIMGIVMELAEKEFDIKEVFGNGFSIYLSTDDEANRFSKCLGNIIDRHIHGDGKTADKYTELYEERVWEIKSQIIDEVKKAALKENYNKKYFWLDNEENIRGYGNTHKECETQAKIQQCESFTILENK